MGAVCGLMAAAVVIGLLLRQEDRPLSRRMETPQSPREVNRAHLEFREGKLSAQGNPRPFGGIMAEVYPSGVRRSRGEVVGGVLHGVSEGWYTNGVLQVHEEFSRGVAHGVRTRWYADGQKAAETPIVNGKVNGIYRRWHENGILAEEIQMADNEPDGISRAYYPSGAPKAVATMKMGEVVDRKSWPDTKAKAAVAGLRHK